MDIFAHTAWTNVVFYKKYRLDKINRFVAVLFGVLPDLLSFVPVFIYGFFARKGFMELVGSTAWPVRFASESYNYTHSIVIFGAIFLVVYLWRLIRKNALGNHMYQSAIYYPLFGWLLHILIDIPTHHGFYETPFLFPLSEARFSYGVSWGTPWFMIVNYSALALTYMVWFLVIRKRQKKLNMI